MRQSTIYYAVHYGVVVGGGGVDAELMRPPPPQQCVSKLTIAARGIRKVRFACSAVYNTENTQAREIHKYITG